MQNIGVILAGGTGKRTGNNVPKQFLSLAGRTVLEHSLEKFDSNSHIDGIVIVTADGYMEKTLAIAGSGNFRKIKHVITGGEERYHSTLNAMQMFHGQECNLLIHDAARPLVSERIINDVVAALATCRAVDVAIPATDTIIEVDPTHSHITSIPDRRFLYQVQTPQGFRLEVLEQAYRLAMQDKMFRTTDDCSVVRTYLPDEKIRLVEGEHSNMKLTYAEDLFLLEHLLKRS